MSSVWLNYMNSFSLREKCLNTKFFLVRIFSHSYWIQRDAERYRVSLHIQSECRKIWTKKNSVFGPFSGRLFTNCLKTCFCMRKHRYLKNEYQFFDALKTKDCKIRRNCNLLTKVKFHELQWSSPLIAVVFKLILMSIFHQIKFIVFKSARLKKRLFSYSATSFFTEIYCMANFDRICL